MNDGIADAAARDAADPLRHLRERFVLPEGLVYLDGNSLGALPRATPQRILSAVEEEWGEGLVRSWNDAGWYELPLTLGDRLAPLLGAAPGQVAICDTTTVNLFKAMAAALALRPGRTTVVMDGGDFPANLYIGEGVLSVAGRQIERRLVDFAGSAAFERALDETVAVVALSQVNYRSGRLLDVAAITERAHAAGALVVWDLCHSAGVVPLRLDEWQVDFAVGCTYKYLSSGPGAPAWIYVAQRHLGRARQPLSGWMGHAAPFEFDARYRPDPGIRGFLCGTPHILSLRGVEAGLDTFDGVEIDQVRDKAIGLTEMFLGRIESDPACAPLMLASPRDPAARGAQVCFAFEHGYAVIQAMIERGVIGDFRAPDILRFGFQPLYLSYAEVARAASVLAQCLRDRVWEEERHRRRAPVT